jgi:Tfp pilus assembly PilM family ATPase
MRILGRSRLSPIGIDLDGRSIRAAQLYLTPGDSRGASHGAGGRLTAATCLPRQSPGEEIAPAEIADLAGVLARQGFRGNRVILAVPEEKLVSGILELPPRSSGAPLEEIARTELAVLHGYDPAAAETVSWDLPPSPRTKHASHALGVACRHADAEAVLDVWEGTGLNVVVLDSRLHAIVRACQPLVAAAGITAILDVEWDRAVLILMQQGTVIYRWMMPDAAIQPLAQLLTDSLSLEEEMAGWLVAEVGLVPPDSAEAALYSCVEALIKGRLDAMAHGMRSPLAYAAQLYPGSTLSRLLLVGPGAGIPGAAAYLQQVLGAGVRSVTPADVVPCSPTLGQRARDPALTAAVGLAQFPE